MDNTKLARELVRIAKALESSNFDFARTAAGPGRPKLKHYDFDYTNPEEWKSFASEFGRWTNDYVQFCMDMKLRREKVKEQMERLKETMSGINEQEKEYDSLSSEMIELEKVAKNPWRTFKKQTGAEFMVEAFAQYLAFNTENCERVEAIRKRFNIVASTRFTQGHPHKNAYSIAQALTEFMYRGKLTYEEVRNIHDKINACSNNIQVTLKDLEGKQMDVITVWNAVMIKLRNLLGKDWYRYTDDEKLKQIKYALQGTGVKQAGIMDWAKSIWNFVAGLVGKMIAPFRKIQKSVDDGNNYGKQETDFLKEFSDLLKELEDAI